MPGFEQEGRRETADTPRLAGSPSDAVAKRLKETNAEMAEYEERLKQYHAKMLQRPVAQGSAGENEAQRVEIMRGIERIETPNHTEQEWMEAQYKLAAAAIPADSAERLAGTMWLEGPRDALLLCDNNSSQNGITFRQSINRLTNLPEFSFDVNVSGRALFNGRWHILPCTGNPNHCVIRKESDPETTAAIPTALMFANRRVNFEVVRKLMSQAVADRQSGMDDAAGVRDFDLPRDRPVGAFGLLDMNDPWERTQFSTYPKLLRQLGYNMVTSGDHVMEVSRDPLAMMRERVRAMRAATPPVRDFYIMVAAHGTTEGTLVFSTPGPDRREFVITPRQIVAVCNEFTDCRFTFDVNACFSGGFAQADYAALFRDEFSTDTSEGRRITVFVQASDIPNIVPGNAADGNATSYYNRMLLYYLSPPQRLPYGRAHLEARSKVNQIYPGFVPRVIRSGRTRGVETARNDAEQEEILKKIEAA